MTGPPVVVFAYNRPDKLRRVLQALAGQGVPRLIVFVDGARTPADLPGVEGCRRLAQSVDWTETELHFSDRNLGVWAIKDHVAAVLARSPAAIFLEDDCLPVPGFYGFMAQALERYAAEPRLFSIGGYQMAAASFFRGYRYSLVSGVRFMGWGWATWSDRWQAAWPRICDYPALFDGLQAVPDAAGSDIGLVARRMVAGETIDNWDIRVALAALSLEQAHLQPVRGLVRNIGLGRTGMHPSLSSWLRSLVLYNRNVAQRAPAVIAWPEAVTPDPAYAAEIRRLVDLSQRLSIRGWFKR